MVIVFIPITLILIIIFPVIKIRWSKNYFPDRVGHLVAELEHYLYFTKKKSIFCIDLFPRDIFFNNFSHIFSVAFFNLRDRRNPFSDWIGSGMSLSSIISLKSISMLIVMAVIGTSL